MKYTVEVELWHYSNISGKKAEKISEVLTDYGIIHKIGEPMELSSGRELDEGEKGLYLAKGTKGVYKVYPLLAREGVA